MKILTWNINGIRASKVPLKQLFTQLDADIICLQETKVTRDQLDEPSAIVDGYNSYFSFSQVRMGYSGVATFVKDGLTPVKAEEGLSGMLPAGDDSIGGHAEHSGFTDDELMSLDREGRCIITQHRIMDCEGEHGLLTVFNVYCVRADPERDDRKAFKLQFYKLLQNRAEAILKTGSHVVVVGDINMSHEEMDTAEPDECKDFWKNPGRLWLHQFLCPKDVNDSISKSDQGGHFVDTFRLFHPDQESAFTCWSTLTGARATNYGARIDYILSDKMFSEKVFTDCIIMPEIEGSDHCPVKATLNCEAIPAKKCPSLCSRYLPEFAGKQQKLSSFFTKVAQKPHSVDSSLKVDQTKTVSKRSNTDLSNMNKVKKPKLSQSGSGSNKQGTLASFFGKKAAETYISTKGRQTVESKSDIIEKSDVTETTSVDRNSDDNKSNKKSNASAWKNLLSGPAPAPLCKGHNEPCLLRTVKKDSLNKGRQFYVCCRPEGHKSNPEARCDHFEWVEKGKTKSKTS